MSPPFTVASMPGIRSASPAGPVIEQSKADFRGQVGFDMVDVVVRRQDAVEPPAMFGKMVLDRLEFRRVDRGGLAGFGVVDENAEIVGLAAELVDDKSHIVNSPR